MAQKSKDKYGRFRSNMVTFKASDDEIRAINEAVSLSGLTKQEYIITKLENRDVVVIGNPRVFKALKSKMDDIYAELIRIESAGELSDRFLDTIGLVANIYTDMTAERR